MRTLGDEWRQRLLKTWLISRSDNQGTRRLIYLIDIEEEYQEWEKKTYYSFLGYKTTLAKGRKLEFRYIRASADDFNPWSHWSYFKDKKMIKRLEHKLAKIMLTRNLDASNINVW